MKKILCYGDSNTFGYNPSDSSRYNEQTRWTGIMQTILAADYTIIEEGACDRTGFVDNPKGVLFSAQKHFPIVLSKPIYFDIIVLALGTNDLQFQYNISLNQVETGLKNLIEIAKTKTDNIILIPSVILNKNVLDGYFKIQFDEQSIEKSLTIGEIYTKLAETYNCHVFDINQITSPSPIDGLHYDKTSHKLIAENLSDFIKKNFSIS